MQQLGLAGAERRAFCLCLLVAGLTTAVAVGPTAQSLGK
jgi:hypothetical protein